MKRPPPPTEHEEEVALTRWLQQLAPRYPDLAMVFKIPNGGGFHGGFKANVIRVKRLEREGLQPGVPDRFVAVAKGGWHGAFVEMKRQRGGTVSAAQNDWAARLLAQGYQVFVCPGADAACRAIAGYLGLPAIVAP